MNNNFSYISMPSIRRSFTAGKKRKILREQTNDNLNNSEIASRHSITPTQVRDWRSKLPLLQQIPRSKKRCRGGGRKSDFNEIEEELNSWIIGQRRAKRAVNVRSVIQKLIELKPEATEKSYFNLQRWTYRFLKRNNLTLRRVTKNTSISDSVLEKRLTNFNEEVMEVFERGNILWINMDQTAVEYDMLPNTTIDFKGSQSIQLKTSGGAGGRVTVILTVCSDGRKLPVLVVFKGKPSGRIMKEFIDSNLNYPSEHIYTVQNNAWTDEVVMIFWISRILSPFVEINLGTNICLVIDSYSSHKTEAVISRFENLGIDYLFIPGGLTSHIQPLDVGINFPFKHWIRNAWINSNITNIRSAQLKRVEISKIISEAWNMITNETVSRSFNKLLEATNQHEGEEDEILIDEEIV